MPLLALLGIAGAAATVATFVFAGVVFGLVVAAGAHLAAWTRRRQLRRDTCASGSAQRPVDLEFSAKAPGTDA